MYTRWGGSAFLLAGEETPIPSELGTRLRSLLILVGLATLLGIASPHFLSADNLLNVGQQSAINALLGIGLTFVILSGGIDLSVGSVLALSGIVCADLLVSGFGTPVAVAAGLLVGLFCGVVNGVVTTAARIPPFITTLGMMLVARSLAKIYSGSRPISGLPEDFRALAGDIAGVPTLLLFVAVFYLVAHFVLTRTKLGRYAYAIGGNEQAAWLSGVAVGRYKTGIFALSGLMAGLAGVLMTARLNAASPLAGDMYELYAIAAAVIGGVSLMGGEGRVFGTLIGALIMGMLRNGLNLLNVPSALEGVVVGGVLVVAVAIDRLRHRQVSATLLAPGWRRNALRAALAGAAVTAVFFAFQQRATLVDASENSRPTFALVPKTLGSPFFMEMARGAEKEAERRGVRLIVQAADREIDVERQYQILENLIEQGVDAILLAPSGSKELVPVIRKANEAGVPVFLVDTPIDEAVAAKAGVRVETFIGSDNLKGGYKAGEYIAQVLGGRGDVAVIEGIPGHETAEQRRAGFLEAVGQYPGLRVVASQTASWERERGYAVAENMLQAHPGLRAIFAANDEMALGALEAIAAARRMDRVRVVGFDANPDAVASVRDGRLLATVAQYPSEMGRLAVSHAAEQLEHGNDPPAIVPTRVELVSAESLAGAREAGE